MIEGSGDILRGSFFQPGNALFRIGFNTGAVDKAHAGKFLRICNADFCGLENPRHGCFRIGLRAQTEEQAAAGFKHAVGIAGPGAFLHQEKSTGLLFRIGAVAEQVKSQHKLRIGIVVLYGAFQPVQPGFCLCFRTVFCLEIFHAQGELCRIVFQFCGRLQQLNRLCGILLCADAVPQAYCGNVHGV